MQGILGHTAPSCCHSCLGCEWNFKHNNKMASCSAPTPIPLTWPSVLLAPHPWDTARGAEKEGREGRATGPDEEAHCPLMKQLPSGQTHYHRLMIWFNYVDKIGGRTFAALSECWGVKRLRLQIHTTEESSQLLTSWSETARNVCLCLHAGHVQRDCYCPAIKAAEVWLRLHNPSPLSGWKVSLN